MAAKKQATKKAATSRKKLARKARNTLPNVPVLQESRDPSRPAR